MAIWTFSSVGVSYESRRQYHAHVYVFHRLLAVEGSDIEQDARELVVEVVCGSGVLAVNVVPLHLQSHWL